MTIQTASQLQHALNLVGDVASPPLTEDGSIGPMTKRAIANFQNQYLTSGDYQQIGVMSDRTREAIENVVKEKGYIPKLWIESLPDSGPSFSVQAYYSGSGAKAVAVKAVHVAPTSTEPAQTVHIDVAQNKIIAVKPFLTPVSESLKAKSPVNAKTIIGAGGGAAIGFAIGGPLGAAIGAVIGFLGGSRLS
jgi:hypothetical protein